MRTYELDNLPQSLLELWELSRQIHHEKVILRNMHPFVSRYRLEAEQSWYHFTRLDTRLWELIGLYRSSRKALIRAKLELCRRQEKQLLRELKEL